MVVLGRGKVSYKRNGPVNMVDHGDTCRPLGFQTYTTKVPALFRIRGEMRSLTSQKSAPCPPNRCHMPILTAWQIMRHTKKASFPPTMCTFTGLLWEGCRESRRYPLHPAPYTLHPTLYTLHSTLYTLHPTLFSQRFTPNTINPTPYTLHPTL
jgi:hypothetical protein